MKIKLTVGEIKALKKFRPNDTSKGGFHTLMVQFYYRMDDASGELDLDDLDFNKIDHYAARGYRKKLKAIFGRTLGDRLQNLD
jgi:hypothetical protein